MKRRLIEASVVLAMLLVFGTGAAAAAEPLKLVCETTRETDYTGTVKAQVDFDNQTVAMIDSAGATLASTTDRRMNALPPMVRISDGAVEWHLRSSSVAIFEGRLDRETGELSMYWRAPESRYGNTFNGRCRRATQKF